MTQNEKFYELKPEYLKAISDVERLAIALEKIADLEKAGILNKLAAVIK